MHMVILFGQYFQIYKEETLRNSTKPLTRGAVCMGPSGNNHCGFKFMALLSMKNVTRCSCDIILMPDTVIDRVNEISQVQPNDIKFLDQRSVQLESSISQ